MLKEISVEILRKCPNNCLHCSSKSNINCNEQISFEKFIEVVDSAKALDVQTICFSGGEPFIHPDIVRMIDYVHSKGIQTYIYTSGIFLDNNNLSEIPESLIYNISSNVTKLIFNLETVTPSIYDSIMGTKDCFKYLKASIESAVKAGITCEAHFVPMKLNISEVEKIIEFCDEVKISKLSFLRFVPHGRGEINKEKLLLSDDEQKCFIEKLKDIKNKRKNSIRIGVPLINNIENVVCEAANGKLNIKYDGYVYPCEVFKNTMQFIKSGAKAESIYEKSLKEIYLNSEYLCSIRQYIDSFKCSHNCENCAGQMYLQEIKSN